MYINSACVGTPRITSAYLGPSPNNDILLSCNNDKIIRPEGKSTIASMLAKDLHHSPFNLSAMPKKIAEMASGRLKEIVVEYRAFFEIYTSIINFIDIMYILMNCKRRLRTFV